MRASTQQELRKAWLFPCRRLLWTLQLSVWNNGFFLPILSLSKSRTCSNWRRHSTWNKKQGNGWNVETIYRGERLHCFWNVGMWIVEFRQNWCVSKRTLEKNIPIQASIASEPFIGQDEIKRNFLWRTEWYQTFKTSKRTICNFFPPIFKNTNVYRQDIGPLMH